MGDYEIHYNERKEPYIIERNFAHRTQADEGSSHWTWHITREGVRFLSKDFFGKPGKMPRSISREQREDLKTRKMLYLHRARRTR